MKLSSRPSAVRWLALSACVIVALGVWRWANTILAPANAAMVLAAGRPVGNNSDLYPRWLGARELLLHGRDPYGPEVTREIQAGFYGRPLDPKNPADPVAQESFVYPIYVIFLIAPTIHLPFGTAAEIFRWLLLFAIACSVPLWMYVVGLRPHWVVQFSIILLAVSSYAAVEEYFQQNLAALVVLFFAAAAAAAVRNWLALSGFLLALATAKPDTTGLVILWFLLWATAKWKERGRLVLSFLGSMAALVVAALAISPHWIGRFLAAVWNYRNYGTDPSIPEALLPRWLAMIATGALAGGFLIVSWRFRQAPAGSESFAWPLAWAAALTLVVIPKLAAYNQLLLIPALLMLVRHGKTSTFLSRALAKAAFACQGWQWVTAVALSLGSYVISASRLRSVALLPLYTLLAMPALVLLALAVALPGARQAPVE
ncbi:MAG: glycosyltransferase 87 family protein [Candidatus Sulfotelmatobacter sp.]